MRFSIRYQLLLPLLALMLGLVAASTWSAYASGQRARQQIEKQIDDIAATVNSTSVNLSVLLARSLARRIEELERRTRLIAAGDFGPMTLPSRHDELRDLGQSVNDMAGKLAQFQETIRTTERLRLLGQVSGGLAHQLRN